MKKTLTLVASLMCMGLAGCGGGGGGGSTSTATTTSTTGSTPTLLAAQGVYEGTTSNGNAFDLLLLENGTYYTLVGSQTGGQFQVSQLVQGSGTSN